jgi:hypothetical protein
VIVPARTTKAGMITFQVVAENNKLARILEMILSAFNNILLRWNLSTGGGTYSFNSSCVSWVYV